MCIDSLVRNPLSFEAKHCTFFFFFLPLTLIAYMELYIKLGLSRVVNSPPTNIFP